MADEAKKNLFDRIAVGAFSVILVVNSIVMTLIITGAALSRYIFKVNFMGYDEIIVLIAFWLYFMGAAYGAYNNSHVTADVVDAYFPDCFARRVLRVLRWVAACVACGLFVYYGFEYFMFSFAGPLGNYTFKPTSMIWRIPLWTSHAGIFTGLIFMEVYFLRNLFLSAVALKRGREA
jgi:TRAP-type C4-dicarboxylate transport system permease small subunit